MLTYISLLLILSPKHTETKVALPLFLFQMQSSKITVAFAAPVLSIALGSLFSFLSFPVTHRELQINDAHTFHHGRE
jgi:hypothetical protein